MNRSRDSRAIDQKLFIQTADSNAFESGVGGGVDRTTTCESVMQLSKVGGKLNGGSRRFVGEKSVF